MIFGLSPMPSHSSSSGVSALAGMYRKKPICGSKNDSADTNVPISTPSTMPIPSEIP